MKSGGWRIFLSAIQVFSSGMVLGEDDRERFGEPFDEGGSESDCWGGQTVISSGVRRVVGCSCGSGVDSQRGVAIL